MYFLIGVGIISFFLYLFWRDNFQKKSHPPGPMKFPIVGNIHQIAWTGRKLPHEAFDMLSTQYGPIMSLKMGMKETIIVSSYEDMVEIFTNDECSGRVLEEFIAERTFGKEQGIVFSNSEAWREVRRFTTRTLIELGFGKRKNGSMEAGIWEEVQDLMDQTKIELSNNSGIVHVDLFFNLNLLSALWTMVAGTRFSRDDQRLRNLMELSARAFRAGNFGSEISIAFPFVRHLFPGWTGANVLSKLFKELHQYFREIYHEHRDRGDYSQNPHCFVDAFLNKSEEEAQEIGTSKYFTEEQFICVMIDLFQTGSETLNGSLSYALLFMILNPRVQKKVQDEIDKVVPQGTINLAHKSQMVYTEATLLEVLRLGDVAPLIPRKVMSHFEYKGYEFKKGMSVMPNLYSVFSSKKYWGDPEQFRPERFIGPDGKLCNTTRMPAFGFGKRICMGEALATSSIFMYFTATLREFTFKTLPNQPEPTTESLAAFTLAPQPFDMLVEIRNKD